VGRPDLLGEKQQRELAAQLHTSLFERLKELPDFIEIFPGHGAGSLCGKAIGSRRSSTMGYERRFNPSMQFMPQAEWAQKLLAGMPPAPPYFQQMKRVNAEGPELLEGKFPGLSALPPAPVRARLEEVVVLDVRSKEAFAAAHLPGAINIGMDDNLPTWAGWVLPYDRPIVLVLDRPSQAEEAARHLVGLGFDRIDGHIEGGMSAWEEKGLPLATMGIMTAQALHRRLEQSRNGEMHVLDVRSESEWSSGHIEGSTNIHAGQLRDPAAALPRDRQIAVLCGSGYRASVAASLLKHLGFQEVHNVLGGMAAWKSAGLPLIHG
jgi:hydroxyacylglutathione hydrolase